MTSPHVFSTPLFSLTGQLHIASEEWVTHLSLRLTDEPPVLPPLYALNGQRVRVVVVVCQPEDRGAKRRHSQ
jgi:hypothetical protein